MAESSQGHADERVGIRRCTMMTEQQSDLHKMFRADQARLKTYLQRQSTSKLFPLAIKGALVMHRQIGDMVCQAPQHHLCEPHIDLWASVTLAVTLVHSIAAKSHQLVYTVCHTSCSDTWARA